MLISDGKILTFAIPTYNRFECLDRALTIIVGQIEACKNKSRISIYVSNNGSSDKTESVLTKFSEICIVKNILFSFSNQEPCLKMGENFIEVYRCSPGEYVWWFSDDDILRDGYLDELIAVLDSEKPNVVNIGFSQPPYNDDNPKYSDDQRGFVEKKEDYVSFLSTKLSALIVRKDCAEKISYDDISDSYWTHIYIVLDLLLREKGLYIFPSNVAECDDQFMNIRYSPNALVELQEVFGKMYDIYGVDKRNFGWDESGASLKVNLYFYRLYLNREVELADDVLYEVQDIIKNELFRRLGVFKPMYYRSIASFVFHLVKNKVISRGISAKS